MLTKHFLAKAYMNRQNESLLTDVIGVPVQLGYAVFGIFGINLVLSVVWTVAKFKFKIFSTIENGK